MERLELLRDLATKNESKILFWVFDGIGGLPHPETGKTELETAETPHLDAFARESSCGGLMPHGAGITPGSGPGHLSLFGYPLDAFDLPRGVLEVLGADGGFLNGNWSRDLDISAADLAMRGNFASVETSDGERVIADRRANRISTEESRRICERLSNELELPGYQVYVIPGKGHRFALMIRGEDLAGGLTDADPQQSGLPPKKVEALNDEAKLSAKIVNELIAQADRILEEESQAQTVLLRGIGTPPEIPSMEELYGIRCAAIATYPMYKGIARLVGMDVLEVGSMEHSDEVKTLEKYYEDYDFFYLHIKETDSLAHLGDFDGKVEVFESCDPLFGKARELGFDVIALTGDHCTPCVLQDHSWHPIPTALWSKTIISGGAKSFDEREVTQGTLGKIPSRDLLPNALAEARRFVKFGA